MELCQGGSGWILGKGSSLEDGWALEWAPQGSGHGPKLTEFNKCQEKSSQICHLIFGECCVEPRAGFDDPCKSLQNWDILRLCDSIKSLLMTWIMEQKFSSFSDRKIRSV